MLQIDNERLVVDGELVDRRTYDPCDNGFKVGDSWLSDLADGVFDKDEIKDGGGDHAGYSYGRVRITIERLESG